MCSPLPLLTCPLPLSYFGVWTNSRTLNITMVNTSQSEIWVANRTTISLRSIRKLMNAARTSRAADGSTTVVLGDWGLLRGPTITGLTAAGSELDAVYNAGDTLTIRFDSPTNRAGFSAGSELNHSDVSDLVACGFFITVGDQREALSPASLGTNLSGVWEDRLTLTLHVVDPEGVSHFFL